MNKVLKYFAPTLVALFLIGGTALAASILSVPQGGTGAGTFPTKSLIVSNPSKATGTLQSLAPGTNGYVLSASSTAPSGFAWVANTAALGATTTITSNVLINGPNFTFATSSVTGLNLNITGSGSTLTFTPQLQGGYNIPLTASTTNWNNFFNTPSTQITAGSGLSWSGNTLSDVKASSTLIAGGTATFSPSVTLSTTADTNLLLSIVCATATCTFTPSWTGTLAAGRLNSNVVEGVTNDTNVTGSISGQNLTLGWTGTLAAGRLNSNVVQSVSTSSAGSTFTASISAQNLALTFPANLLSTTTAAATYYLQSNPSSYIALTALSGTSPITYNNSTGAIGFNGSGYVSNSYASSTFPSFTYGSSTYQGALSLTTTGSSGAATLSGNTLNIPQYSGGGGSGGVGTTSPFTNGHDIMATGTTPTLTNGVLIDNGTILGYNATSSMVDFNLQGSTGSTNALFNLATSTGTSVLKVDNNGNITLQPANTSTPLTILNPSGQQELVVDSNASFTHFNIGAATSTQIATLFVEGSSASTTAPLLVVASSSGASYLIVDQFGHRLTGGDSPTCNMGCTASDVWGDDNNIRVIDSSTAVTTLTITFAHAYTHSPACFANEESGGTVGVFASSTPTTVVLNFASSLTSKSIDVHCESSTNFIN